MLRTPRPVTRRLDKGGTGLWDVDICMMSSAICMVCSIMLPDCRLHAGRMHTFDTPTCRHMHQRTTAHSCMLAACAWCVHQILKYSERTGTRRMMRLDGFADHTTKDTWDFSAWVRAYSVYLDERLEVRGQSNVSSS